MKRERPVVLSVTSDHHAGSTLGLCPPRYPLDDGGEYVASKAQRWLWKRWGDYVERVQYKVALTDAKLVSIFNGDLVEGNHHGTYQVISANETTMMNLAYKVLSPLIELSDEVFVVRGTPAHAGSSGRLEEKIAEDLTNIHRDGENSSWIHLPLKVNGTTFDIAHHGRLGRLPWTKANGAHQVASIVLVDYLNTGDIPPNIIIRSHLHEYADTYMNYDALRLIATPGWQFPTAYVHRRRPGAVADIGGLIITCWPGGTYEVDVVRFRPKRRTPEEVKPYD